MHCLICISSDGELQKFDSDMDNETAEQITFVLPDFLIPESQDPLFICSPCLEQVTFFYTIKKTSLQNCRLLKHFNAMLKGTDNFKCNELRIILNSHEGSAQRKHQIKFNPISKHLLASEDQDATQIKEEDKTYEFHHQQFVNAETSLNQLQDDSPSSSSNKSTVKHKNSRVDKLTKKDSNLTSNDSRHEDQPKTQRESQKKIFTCVYCQKTFPWPSLLEIHKRVHTGEKPFKCTTCQKAFTQRTHLHKHELIHTREILHKCDFCHETFKQESQLTSHKQFYDHFRPFQCSVCSKGFIQSGDLNRHMLTHTGEKPHQCDLCEYKCALAGHLKRHIRSHTGEKPYSCKHCDKSFTTTTCLKQHERRLHSNEHSK